MQARGRICVRDGGLARKVDGAQKFLLHLEASGVDSLCRLMVRSSLGLPVAAKSTGGCSLVAGIEGSKKKVNRISRPA